MSKFEVTNGDGKIAKTTSMREASGQGASGRFFSKKELEDMFPGIADRAVRWDPNTWSDETHDFAEDRGKTVPELLDVLVTIDKAKIEWAVETAIDYAIVYETDDYDYEGLDGELIGAESDLIDDLSDFQSDALIYVAHFTYEEQYDVSHGDEDEDDL